MVADVVFFAVEDLFAGRMGHDTAVLFVAALLLADAALAVDVAFAEVEATEDVAFADEGATEGAVFADVAATEVVAFTDVEAAEDELLTADPLDTEDEGCAEDTLDDDDALVEGVAADVEGFEEVRGAADDLD